MSQRFDDILDACIEQVLRGEPIETCLARYPDQADALAPLLRVARLATEATAGAPRPEFRAAARDRLLARLEEKRRAAASSPRPRPRGLLTSLTGGLAGVFGKAEAAPPARRPIAGRAFGLRLAPIAAILLLMFVSSGSLVASASSLPGEPLYPVKLAAEQARLWTTTDESARAELHTELADRRLAEVEALLARRGEADVPTIEASVREAERAADLAARSGSSTPAPVVTRLVDVTARQQQVLTGVLERAPAAARPGLERALEASRRGHERATRAIEPSPGSPAKPATPPTGEAGEGHGQPSAAATPGRSDGNSGADDRPGEHGRPNESNGAPANTRPEGGSPGSDRPKDQARPDDRRGKPESQGKPDDPAGRALTPAKPGAAEGPSGKPEPGVTPVPGGPRPEGVGKPTNRGNRPGEGHEHEHGNGGPPPSGSSDDSSGSRR